jgi:uncharacterized protein
MAKAAEWYQKAADAGDALAMAKLGYMYSVGEGVAKDPAKAVAFSKQAAEAGDTLGMNNYGFYLVSGQGVAQDVKSGMTWLRKGMAGGGETAPTSLAEIYEAGKVVPYDARKSAQYYLLALKRGDSIAKQVLVESGGKALKSATLDAIQQQLNDEGLDVRLTPGVMSEDLKKLLADYRN